MQGSEEIGKRGEFLSKLFFSSFLHRPIKEVGKRGTLTEFLNDHTVKAPIQTKGADHGMRIAGKTDAPQPLKVVEFSLHAAKSRLGRAVQDATKKLSDKAHPVPWILVKADMIRGRNAVHPKVRRGTIEAELRENFPAEIDVEVVLLGKMP